MTPKRLLELWEPPPGLTLASILATTYELQADFVEEDLLPVALDLGVSAGRGKQFRIELERALQDAEVTLFFEADRYQRGLRRSPRIDLVPSARPKPKLHAKVSLLRYVSPEERTPEAQVVRLIVGSANLTSPGYRSNIEVAVAIDDAPGCAPEVATAVRDATRWLKSAMGTQTEQSARQLRDLNNVFLARPVAPVRGALRFVGLPQEGGLPEAIPPTSQAGARITVASPFWPTGDRTGDVVGALERLGGGSVSHARLIGPAHQDDSGEIYPEVPRALVRELLERGIRVSVAAARPGYGCEQSNTEPVDEEELDFAAKGSGKNVGRRDLHAKAVLVEGESTAKLAIGSFNTTRKGFGLVAGSNLEAGLLWTVPSQRAFTLAEVFSFAGEWRHLERGSLDQVRDPEPIDGDDDQVGWPAFLVSLHATRSSLQVEGMVDTWPDEVSIRMRDIRGRQLGQGAQWFDTLIVARPSKAGQPMFRTSLPLMASWLSSHRDDSPQELPLLPDLEAEVSWDGKATVVPVIFLDKHLFPVIESRQRPDEQALIAWFLGLRTADEVEANGFAHGIDLELGPREERPPDREHILSYLIRDFVHALPGVRERLEEAAVTETGLRTALLGPRSPVALARAVAGNWRHPEAGGARKTLVATAFQLGELLRVLKDTALPRLGDGVAESLRDEALGRVQELLNEIVRAEDLDEGSRILQRYLSEVTE